MLLAEGNHTMTPRERFAAALDRRPITGLVPTFELVFFLTMQAFGKIHPSHRNYRQWDQMQASERELHRRDMARLYVDTAERFGHSAIMIHVVMGNDWAGELVRMAEHIRAISGDRFFLCADGDGTFALPDGNSMVTFSNRIADEPEKLDDEAARNIDRVLASGERIAKAGVLDGFTLCCDYCLNTGPFLSPRLFRRFVTPHLKRMIAGYRSQGFYTIKHTDGNIMPILDQLVECNPHALHSIDPQAKVDMHEVKRLVGDKVCLIGNVDCGLMDTGTDEQVVASARYALDHGMPGGGYIFSTSNCVYTGMRLERYELIQRVWREHGVYAQAAVSAA